ncbi:unnamed protein product [Amoebophrya sp. A25]|nr:unnamed protein product [Amoebophrya sp. A25]|eukprot:GSA25T00017853001.1
MLVQQDVPSSPIISSVNPSRSVSNTTQVVQHDFVLRTPPPPPTTEELFVDKSNCNGEGNTSAYDDALEQKQKTQVQELLDAEQTSFRLLPERLDTPDPPEGVDGQLLEGGIAGVSSSSFASAASAACSPTCSPDVQTLRCLMERFRALRRFDSKVGPKLRHLCGLLDTAERYCLDHMPPGREVVMKEEASIHQWPKTSLQERKDYTKQEGKEARSKSSSSSSTRRNSKGRGKSKGAASSMISKGQHGKEEAATAKEQATANVKGQKRGRQDKSYAVDLSSIITTTKAKKGKKKNLQDPASGSALQMNRADVIEEQEPTNKELLAITNKVEIEEGNPPPSSKKASKMSNTSPRPLPRKMKKIDFLMSSDTSSSAPSEDLLQKKRSKTGTATFTTSVQNNKDLKNNQNKKEVKYYEEFPSLGGVKKQEDGHADKPIAVEAQPPTSALSWAMRAKEASTKNTITGASDNIFDGPTTNTFFTTPPSSTLFLSKWAERNLSVRPWILRELKKIREEAEGLAQDTAGRESFCQQVTGLIRTLGLPIHGGAGKAKAVLQLQ